MTSHFALIKRTNVKAISPFCNSNEDLILLRETIIFLKVEKLIQISVDSLKTHLNSNANLCLCTFDQFKGC